MQQGVQPRKKALGYLITFFVVMLILTLLSTTLANISAARVNAAAPERMALSHKLDAQGVISAGGETILFMDELFVQLGIYVDSVSVHEGGKVSQGGPVLQLNMEQLGRALEDAKDALAKQQLTNQLSNIQNAFKPDPSLEEAAEKKKKETANRRREEKLQAADEAVALAERNLSGSIEAFDRARSNLSIQQQKSAENATRAYESNLADAQTAVDQAQDALRSAQVSYSSGMLPFRRVVEDCEKAMIAAQEAYDADPENPVKKNALEDAQKAYQRAEEDYRNSSVSYEDAIAKAKKNLTAEQNKLAEIKNKGIAPFLDAAVVEAAQASVGQAEKAVADCITAINKAKQDREKAIAEVEDEIWQEQYDSLRQEDEARITSEQEAADSKKKQLEIQLQDMELKALKEKVEKLQSLMDMGGTVKSQYSGVISGVSVQSGLPVTEVAAKVVQGSDILSLTCSVSKKVSQYFKPGDMATISFPDSEKEAVQAPIQNVVDSPADAETVNLTVAMGKGEAEAGMQARLEAEKKTKLYDCVIPKEVLKSDSEGYFVFVVRRKEEGWGIKTYAERIDVRVLEQAANDVSIQGAVGMMDLCIKASNKPIATGDRVRVVDE